jgi:hypothetical protein
LPSCSDGKIAVLIVPPEALVMSSAQALVAGTSGWAGGSQIETFRSTVLSCPKAGASAGTAPASAKTAAKASFFMAFSPDCL